MLSWSGDRPDLLGAYVRVGRLVERAEDLLDGQSVYHWHSKLSRKPAHDSARWDWHQDFGSWYEEGCLFPDMLSVAVALEPQSSANGCLQLLRGSHRMGRIRHGSVGAAQGADPEVVEHALATLVRVECEMQTGDAVFFHANTLHASGPNNTEQARNLLIVSYNATANQPANPLPFHQFGSLDVLPNDALANSERWPEIDVDTLLAPEAIEGGSDSYGYQVQRDPKP